MAQCILFIKIIVLCYVVDFGHYFLLMKTFSLSGYSIIMSLFFSVSAALLYCVVLINSFQIHDIIIVDSILLINMYMTSPNCIVLFIINA